MVDTNRKIGRSLTPFGNVNNSNSRLYQNQGTEDTSTTVSEFRVHGQ